MMIGTVDQEPTDATKNALFEVYWCGFLSGMISLAGTWLEGEGLGIDAIQAQVSDLIATSGSLKARFLVTAEQHGAVWEIHAVAPEVRVIGVVH